MYTISKQQFIDDINAYARRHSKDLLARLCNMSLVDKDFIIASFNDLDTFAVCIRKQCIHDLSMLNKDISIGYSLHESYETFGMYAYDMLSDSFAATNASLLCNNQLHSSLAENLNLNMSDLSIASGLISLNLFSDIACIKLTNFEYSNARDEILYKMTIDSKHISGFSAMSKYDYVNDFLRYEELGRFLALLRSGWCNQLLKDWHAMVNCKLLDKKLAGDLAWHTMYAVYQKELDYQVFTKQSGDTICELRSSNSHMTEELKHGKYVKNVDWKIDRSKLLQLDYFNNLNFVFVE